MKREDILLVYNAGPEAVIKLINSLTVTIAKLEEQVEKQLEQITKLKERIKTLEDRLNKNSRNSSKPPSTDNFVRPKSQRQKSGKPVGGQKGHPGHTLKMVDDPDHTVIHQVFVCKRCGKSLKEIEATNYERHQVFDLPPIKVEVNEHRAESKICPYCGCLNKATFPEEAQQPVQYGPRLRSIGIYLSQYQLLPYERISELFADLFDHQISQATLVNANKAAYEVLEPVEEEIKQQIIASAVVHFDKTGLYTKGEREWLHVASTEKLTYYAAHSKRGHKATDEIDTIYLISSLNFPGFSTTSLI